MTQHLTIDANSLTRFQTCPRRWALERDWKINRWRPKALFDACLREGIYAVSNGIDADTAAVSARTQFLQSAANPGIETPSHNPYAIALDWCSMLDTILRTLPKLTLLMLHEPTPTLLTDDVTWRPTAWADDSGTLHRWITVDRWGQSDLYREAHGWYVFGDMSVMNAPMTLHVIEIGQLRGMHHASPWARRFKHPGIPTIRQRFADRNGKELSGWKPVYLADLRGDDADVQAWADQAWDEGATPPLLHHIDLTAPTDTVSDDTVDQILTESDRMLELLSAHPDWHELPMHRSACDAMVPCPWQPACYARDPRASSIPELEIARLREGGLRWGRKAELERMVIAATSKDLAARGSRSQDTRLGQASAG